MLDRLIEDSKNGLALIESAALAETQLDATSALEARHYVTQSKDATAYHLLFALQTHAPDVYRALPADVRAAVLCGALGQLKWLNDWGYLDPSESYDGRAAKALLETGASALLCLRPLLEDLRPAPLFGSEEATMSHMYKYRRADFAYRYISLISGHEPGFEPNPDQRDPSIRQLAERLRP